MVLPFACEVIQLVLDCAIAEVELGLGIHGEAGVRKQALQSADDTTDQLIAAILSDAKVR